MSDRFREVARDARFAVRLTVNCYLAEKPGRRKIAIPVKEITFRGVVKNISSKGACLIASYPLKVKEVLKVSFPIVGTATKFISTPRTLVEVMWKKPYNKRGQMLGLRFLL